MKPAGNGVVRGGMTYMSVGLLQRAIGFLLLPLYARVLPPEEYGTVALLLTVFGGAQFLLSFGLEIAVFRGYFLHSDDEGERHRYINTLGLFLLIAPFVLMALISIVLLLVSRATAFPVGLVVAELLSAAIYVAATVMPLAVIRAQERLSQYVQINAAYAIGQIAIKAILVLGLGMGVRGWVLSDLMAAGLMLMVSMRLLSHRWSREFDRVHLHTALALGLPMLPHLLSHWVLSLSDRLVVGILLDARQVGLYSMGYQFGVLLGIALGETNRAVLPAYGRAVSSKSARQELSATATTQILLAAVLGASVALLAPPVIRLILPASYYPAAIVVPTVALGYIFFGWYYVPMNAVSIIAGDTKYVSIPTLFAAGLNVGLNFLLIPRWGIIAAGINTAISYGVLLVMVGSYKHFRVQWRLSLDRQRRIVPGRRHR